MTDHLALVMGPSGCGKTTIGSQLAQRLGWSFLDADDLHPAANVVKMSAGIPLTDEDRAPWLEQVAGWIQQRRGAGEPGVVACSALKRKYRDQLRGADPGLRVIYLDGGHDLLARRLAGRHGHFFPKTLLEEQLKDLEEPGPDEDPIVVPIGLSPSRAVDAIVGELAR